MANIEELERQIALLSHVEREKLFSKFEREPQTQCRSITTSELKAQLAEKRFAGGTFCPFCGARHVVRAGRQADGSQRYLCKSCGRRFQSTSATLLKNGVSPELLQILKRYVHCMCLARILHEPQKNRPASRSVFLVNGCVTAKKNGHPCYNFVCCKNNNKNDHVLLFYPN